MRQLTPASVRVPSTHAPDPAVDQAVQHPRRLDRRQQRDRRRLVHPRDAGGNQRLVLCDGAIEIGREVDRLVRGAPPVPPVRRVRAQPPTMPVATLDHVTQPRVETPDHMDRHLLHTVRQEGVPRALRQRRNVPEADRRIGKRDRPALDDPGQAHPVRESRQHLLPAPGHRIEIPRRSPVHRDRREHPDRHQLAAERQAGLLIHPPPVRHLMGERPDVGATHRPAVLSRGCTARS